MTGTIIVVPAGDNRRRRRRGGRAPDRCRRRSSCTPPPTRPTPTATRSRRRLGVRHRAVRRPTPTTPCTSTRTPGTYVVRLRVSDSRGGLHVEEFTVTVTGDRRPPGPRPADRRGAPGDRRPRRAGAGTAPLAVAFSTQVTTRGTVRPYSVGLEDYPDLTGEAVMVRSRGTDPHHAGRHRDQAVGAARRPVHVHEQACGDELGGAHFRFDTTQPFAEANEIWPLFTSDADGRERSRSRSPRPLRAGPKAVVGRRARPRQRRPSDRLRRPLARHRRPHLRLGLR